MICVLLQKIISSKFIIRCDWEVMETCEIYEGTILYWSLKFFFNLLSIRGCDFHDLCYMYFLKFSQS